MDLTIVVSEDLNATPRARTRFCATVPSDSDTERAGFGSSERNALYDLAHKLNIHPGTIMTLARIERVAFR